jgi:hypothetical protein
VSFAAERAMAIMAFRIAYESAAIGHGHTAISQCPFFQASPMFCLGVGKSAGGDHIMLPDDVDRGGHIFRSLPHSPSAILGP